MQALTKVLHTDPAAYDSLLADRIVVLAAPITDDTATVCIAHLLLLQDLDDSSPITLVLNTNGGMVTSALAICDTLGELTCPVHCIAHGQCSGMGLFLLLVGDKGHRYLTRHTEIYLEPVTAETPSRIAMKEIKKLNRFLARILAKHSKFNGWTSRRFLQKSHKLAAEEALQMQIIDEVINPIG